MHGEGFHHIEWLLLTQRILAGIALHYLVDTGVFSCAHHGLLSVISLSVGIRIRIWYHIHHGLIHVQRSLKRHLLAVVVLVWLLMGSTVDLVLRISVRGIILVGRGQVLLGVSHT